MDGSSYRSEVGRLRQGVHGLRCQELTSDVEMIVLQLAQVDVQARQRERGRGSGEEGSADELEHSLRLSLRWAAVLWN